MSNRYVVDFPLSFDEMSEVFDVMNFLDENRDELIQKFKPQVIGYLERSKYFPSGMMKKAHEAAFEDLILGLIKSEIETHFNFNPEQILILTQKDLIDMLSGGYFFNAKNYLK